MGVTTPPYTPETNCGQRKFDDSNTTADDTIFSEANVSGLTTTSSIGDDFDKLSNNPYESPVTPFEDSVPSRCGATFVQPLKDTENVLGGLLGLGLQGVQSIQGLQPITGSDSTVYDHYELHSDALKRTVLPREMYDLKLLDKVGSGANSYVYRAQLTPLGGSPEEVAVKIPSSRNKVKMLEREMQFMLDLQAYRHEIGESCEQFPFVQCHGLYYLNRSDFKMMRKRDELPCMLMKLMDGSLGHLITECRRTAPQDQIVLGESAWWQLAATLLHSLEILRDMRSVDCDYKTENVMVSLLKDSCMCFKVIDFSSAATVGDIAKSGEMPQMTPQFTPPELMSTKDRTIPPSYSTDLFSCGLVLLHAATGRMPYEDYVYDQYYMLTLVKDNMAMEVLDRESSNILSANPSASQLIRMIVQERCSLDSAIDYYRSHAPVH